MGMLENLSWRAIIIFIGLVLTAIGGIWSAHQQAISEKELNKKSDEIAELNKQIASSITGGDNFVDIYPIIDLGTPEQLSFMLINSNETPLFDVQVQINDGDAAASFTKSHIRENRLIATHQELLSATQNILYLGTVHGKSAKPSLATYALSGYQSRNFFIDTWAKNGRCRTNVYGVRTEGGWVFSYRREGTVNGKKLPPTDFVPPGFPLKASEIPW